MEHWMGGLFFLVLFAGAAVCLSHLALEVWRNLDD